MEIGCELTAVIIGISLIIAGTKNALLTNNKNDS